jgi:beta-lactamase regulating signal transducer with metallopeptidase domain
MVVLVLAAQWMFGKHLAPRWRSALWLLVVARLVLPFSFGSVTSVFNLLPRWTQPIPAVRPAITSVEIATVPDPTRPPLPNAASLAPITTVVPIQHQSWPWPILIFATWLAGVILLAGHVVVSSVRLWRRCNRRQPLTEPVATTVLEVCCARLEVRTPPALFESAEISSPALHGLFRPRLLLPKGFTARFSSTELRFVFLHELAHLKRRDLWLNWVMAVLQAIHWFNPLVWFGFARWRSDRELACDALALEAAGQEQNQEYGQTILRLLESFSRPMSTPGLVGILEDKRQLRRRIDMIASYVPTRRWPLALLLAGGLAVVGLTDARNPTTSAESSPAINTLQEKGNDMNISNHLAQAAVIGLFATASPPTAAPVRAEDTAASAPSQPSSDLTGAWVLVGTPDKVGKAPATGGRFKFVTGSDWCDTQADPKTGVVIIHHGGSCTFNGNDYFQSIKYANPTTMNLIGRTNIHFTFKIEGDLLTLNGVGNPWNEVWKRVSDKTAAASSLARNLTGIWVLVGTPGNVGTAPAAGGRIKFITATDWCATESDPKTGVVVNHHGGSYTLKGNEYVETVNYANPGTMGLIGRSFKFGIKLEGDTLTLTGDGNPWTEVWQRVK